MNRITIEQVKVAYEKTGLTPIRGTLEFGEGCPVDALLAERGVTDCHSGYSAADALDVSPLYIRGFIDGVDGNKNGCRADNPAYHLGYIDGAAVAAELFGEAS